MKVPAMKSPVALATEPFASPVRRCSASRAVPSRHCRRVETRPRRARRGSHRPRCARAVPNPRPRRQAPERLRQSSRSRRGIWSPGRSRGHTGAGRLGLAFGHAHRGIEAAAAGEGVLEEAEDAVGAAARWVGSSNCRRRGVGGERRLLGEHRELERGLGPVGFSDDWLMPPTLCHKRAAGRQAAPDPRLGFLVACFGAIEEPAGVRPSTNCSYSSRHWCGHRPCRGRPGSRHVRWRDRSPGAFALRAAELP
jgi:hypothetical protein